MKVKIGGKEYKIWFKHSFASVRVMGSHKIKALTSCYIVDNSGIICGALGFAYCSVADNFQKSIGRKIALSRAVQPFTRAERKEIWDQYFDYVGGYK
jgi:hypothetical protein